MRRGAGFAIDHYVAMAGIVAIVGTVFYGLAYARFYDQLNITPEQAGLTPTQILTHSAAGGVALIGLVAAAIFCTVLPLVAARDDLAAAKERGSWRRLAANVSITVFGIFAMFWLAFLSGAPWQWAAFLSVVAAGLLLGISFRIDRAGWRRGLEPRPLRFSGDRYLTVFLAAALPGGLFATGASTFQQADFLSSQVADGVAVRDPKIAGLPFLGVRAEPALISWTARPPGSGIPHCVFYLGGTGDNAVFYDHRSDSTFHVPTGDFSLELRGGIDTCDAPVNLTRPVVHRGPGDTFACKRGRWETYLRPYYFYDWTADGVTIQERARWKRGHVLTAENAAGWRGVHCRVTAESPLGSDFAVSRGASPSPGPG